MQLISLTSQSCHLNEGNGDSNTAVTNRVTMNMLVDMVIYSELDQQDDKEYCYKPPERIWSAAVALLACHVSCFTCEASELSAR